MKRLGLLPQLRILCTIFSVGLSFGLLALLAAHFGSKASHIENENDRLKAQVRDLVGHLAELESLLNEVARQRETVEEITLATLGAVLDTTRIDSQKQGELYLASLSNEDRLLAAPPAVHAGPPASAASFGALVARTTAMRERAKRLVEELHGTARVIELRRGILASIPSRLPADGWISSEFGPRASPFHSGQRMHRGLDVAADIGTPVYATADGIVGFAGTFGGFGRYIRINHGFGIVTRYAHNAELFVKAGDRVRRGDRIALIGNTGRSTGPHLHYEVLVHGEPVDPARFIFDRDATVMETPLTAEKALQHRPMGGETEITNDETRDEDSMVAERALALEDRHATPKVAGLFAWSGGERLIFAAAMPQPLGHATTTDVVMIICVLLLLAVASSSMRGTGTPQVVEIEHPATQRPVASAREHDERWGHWEQGLWGHGDSDD